MDIFDDDGDDDVFHEGEIAVQELAGERHVAEQVAGMLGPVVMPGARPFLAQQQLIVLATVDAMGRPRVGVWFGRRGFVTSDAEGAVVHIDRSNVAPLAVDPVGDVLRESSAVGLLAIELETRRRLRINGHVRTADAATLIIDVDESFPNCPKYIAKRHLEERASSSSAADVVTRGTTLDEARRATIARSDTMFVGSAHPERGADASHRGGAPGFVRVEDDHTLRIPDYAGNGMFQTLGNLHSTPRAALVFLDFEGRRLLHVAGQTTLHLGGEDPTLVTAGTGRSWDLSIEEWVEGPLPSSIAAELLARSRVIPRS